MRWLKSWVKGGADELGWDDLLRRTVKAVADTAHYGARGAVSFPPDVDVVISATPEKAQIAREFVQQAAFDRELGAQLVNRCDCAAADLPLRSYAVEEGERFDVRAVPRDGGAPTWQLRVEGGDFDGQTLPLPARTEIRFGRGRWHGGDRQVTNDLIVSEACSYVSRRAGRLIPSGHVFEVESLDQGDLLFVCRAGGDTLRPSRSASGRAALRAGDIVELSDGGEHSIRLILERQPS